MIHVTYEPYYELLPVEDILSVMWKEYEHQKQQRGTDKPER